MARLSPEESQLTLGLDALTVSPEGRPWYEWFSASQEKAIDELMGDTVDLDEDGQFSISTAFSC